MWRREWDYWTDEAELAQMEAMFSEPARLCLPPLEQAGLLELVDDEREILPGIRVLPAPGHTPGHMVATIRSGDEEMIYLADTVLHVSEFEHIDRVSTFEQDHDRVRSTRRRMLERCAEDEAAVHAFHVAEAGRVRRNGETFAWEPMG
jgi:glyoxylase-like metal-dependent hydrolase (beta-lactamase superfamily II)